MSNGDPTGDVRNEIIDLTPTPLAIDTQSTREYLEVTVPPDAVSVELFAEGVSDPSVRMDFARLVQTDDDFVTTTLLYKSGSLTSPMQVSKPTHPAGVALLYPNGPTSSFTPSTAGKTIKLGALLFAAGPTTVRVFASIKQSICSVLPADLHWLTQASMPLSTMLSNLPRCCLRSASRWSAGAAAISASAFFQ